MMKRRHYYLELKEGEKVIKRKPTDFGSHNRDWDQLENFKKEGQEITLVISSEKEKVIN